MKNKSLVASLLAMLTAATLADAEEIRLQPDKRTDLKITIYNENLALVKDKRNVSLHKGTNEVAYIGVSSVILPESALLNGGTGIRVIEQNYNYDLLSPENIIRKSVGKKVKLIDTFDNGQTKEVEAEILSVNGNVVYKVGDEIEIAPRGRVVFSSLPEGLRDEPTLVMTLLSDNDTQKDVELSYLTSGLSWKADYIAELNASDTKMDFSGLVTLNNVSGVSYDKASLQLVAGDVNIVRRPPRRPMLNMAMNDAMSLKSAGSAMEEETFADYHLYTMPRKVTIADKQTKQVSLLNASNVGVVKEYVYNNPFFYGGPHHMKREKMNPESYLKFENAKSNNLGVSLPKGIIRVYKNDKNGNMQFVGSDFINHTPDKESVKVKTGSAFDITADAYVEQIPSYAGRQDYELTMILKNGSDAEKTVHVLQDLSDNTFLDSENIKSVENKTRSSRDWTVNIPAKGKKELKIKVHVPDQDRDRDRDRNRNRRR